MKQKAKKATKNKKKTISCQKKCHKIEKEKMKKRTIEVETFRDGKHHQNHLIMLK